MSKMHWHTHPMTSFSLCMTYIINSTAQQRLPTLSHQTYGLSQKSVQNFSNLVMEEHKVQLTIQFSVMELWLIYIFNNIVSHNSFEEIAYPFPILRERVFLQRIVADKSFLHHQQSEKWRQSCLVVINISMILLLFSLCSTEFLHQTSIFYLKDIPSFLA